MPAYPGRERFSGVQLHSADYRSPEPFHGQRVLVVGGGNSGAQILAEVSRVACATWVTLEPPTFLPDHIDGRYLFDQATERYRAEQEGKPVPPPASLGDIVMVEPVRDARARRVLQSVPPFERFTEDGVVWATLLRSDRRLNGHPAGTPTSPGDDRAQSDAETDGVRRREEFLGCRHSLRLAHEPREGSRGREGFRARSHGP